MFFIEVGFFVEVVEEKQHEQVLRNEDTSCELGVATIWHHEQRDGVQDEQEELQLKHTLRLRA